MTDIETPLLSPQEAAKILRVHRKTLVRWEDAGHITAVRTPGGHRRYKKSEVLGILQGKFNANG